MTKIIPGTQSFSRSIAVLQAISDCSAPPTAADLLADCGLSRPTLFRILASLEAEGLARKTNQGCYLPGIRLVGLARRALEDMDIRSLARSELESLRDRTGETVHLAIRSGDEMVYIDKIESLKVVRMASSVGARVALHSTSVGKSFLSALPAAEFDAVMARLDLNKLTDQTTTTPQALIEQAEKYRHLGYINDDQENETGISCFGAAILNEQLKPIAAVSISVPVFRVRAERSFYTNPLQECVTNISRAAGAHVT
ncbi:MAG: IclR family transcriptional regulator [Alphaproteobacteria bacterium]|nr:IclR family transcriptional regulator [Alphaproteobacteria bacterium]